MSPAQLAERIENEAWRNVKIKHGRTNGQPVLHILDVNNPNHLEVSRTIKNFAEWLSHPLHPHNKPSKKREAFDEGI